MYETIVVLSDALRIQLHVAENKKLLDSFLISALKKFGIKHLTTLTLRYNLAHAIYMYHFFGYDGYRDDYHRSVGMLIALAENLPLEANSRALSQDGPERRLIVNVHELRAYALNHRLE